MNRKHRRHTLFAVLAALAVACQDAPETPDTVATPEAPVPGDPAQYAPGGWPLQIGDKITHAEFEEIQKDFPQFGPGHALHLVDDRGVRS